MSYVIITLDDGTEQMYLEINCSCFKQQTDSYKVYSSLKEFLVFLRLSIMDLDYKHHLVSIDAF